MRLLLIRHGETASNVVQALDTAAPGAPLNEVGVAQAERLAEQLATEELDAVYSSPLIRARMTATPLATTRGLLLAEYAGLREISAGELEMRTDMEAQLAYRDVFFRWLQGDLLAKIPGGEDGRTALERFSAVIERAGADGTQSLAVVSHGAMLMTWLASRKSNFDLSLLRHSPLQNTGVAVLESGPADRWTVHSWQGQTLSSGSGGATRRAARG
ncbi:histidine phosphatase family protein [Paeniglutamicibacter sp. NPDC012692]|uniref:histidine phosphatase family protein n=1 Tax=Paeniglutamicibacter sp. NPDC012692 TaxID=3364388 RepID=UPI00367E5ABB